LKIDHRHLRLHQNQPILLLFQLPQRHRRHHLSYWLVFQYVQHHLQNLELEKMRHLPLLMYRNYRLHLIHQHYLLVYRYQHRLYRRLYS